MATPSEVFCGHLTEIKTKLNSLESNLLKTWYNVARSMPWSFILWENCIWQPCFHLTGQIFIYRVNL